jgi:hypothetical protein
LKTLPPDESTPQSAVQVEVDFDRVVENATEVFGEFEPIEDTDTRLPSDSGIPIELIPVALEDGSIWWLADGDAVGVVAVEKYRHRLVADLRPGDLVVVPRGEGREELFSRLVEAVHGTGDVRDLDFMLARFRKACVTVYEKAGNNWAEAKRRMQAKNASAWHQIRAWAEGSTIAPGDPSDVKIVAELAGDEELYRAWRNISAVAGEVRRLHRKIGHLVSAALREMVEGQGPNLESVRSQLPADVSEILDEFVVRRIVSVGEPDMKPSNYHGIVTGE